MHRMNAYLHRGALAGGALLQHQQRWGLPSLGLPFPCSSQGRTLFTLKSVTSPPLPLETLPQCVALLVRFSWRLWRRQYLPFGIFCATESASRLKFSDDQGITLDTSPPGVALRKLLPLSHAYALTLSIYIYFFFCLHRQRVYVFNSKWKLIAAAILFRPSSDQHDGNWAVARYLTQGKTHNSWEHSRAGTSSLDISAVRGQIPLFRTTLEDSLTTPLLLFQHTWGATLLSCCNRRELWWKRAHTLTSRVATQNLLHGGAKHGGIMAEILIPEPPTAAWSFPMLLKVMTA